MRVGERVDAVDEDARRSPEACCLGVFDRVDNASLDRDLRVFSGEGAEVPVCDLPVRAVLEAQEGYVHDPTVNLVPRLKVKGTVYEMNIGELSTTCGTPTQTIRFYERRGLLAEPERQPNGYRTYNQEAVDQIAFIRRAQRAGLTLAEIGGVLDVRSEGLAPCGHVASLLTAKLADVTDRMRELRTLRRELEALIDRSEQLDPTDCTDDDICHILGPLRPR